MFWFAGLLGMAIESKRVRQWLAASSISASGLSPRRSDQSVAEPPSYVASFNPFPALVIGVTGAAMAAHAQTYLFQVRFLIYPLTYDGSSLHSGSNSSTLGQSVIGMVCSEVSYILLPLARTSTLNIAFPAPN